MRLLFGLCLNTEDTMLAYVLYGLTYAFVPRPQGIVSEPEAGTALVQLPTQSLSTCDIDIWMHRFLPIELTARIPRLLQLNSPENQCV